MKNQSSTLPRPTRSGSRSTRASGATRRDYGRVELTPRFTRELQLEWSFVEAPAARRFPDFPFVEDAAAHANPVGGARRVKRALAA